MNTNPLVLNNGLPSTLPLSGSSAFASYFSSQVTTISSGITSGTFTTFSNSPAFTITPTISGTYKLYVSAPIEVSGASAFGNIQIIATSGSPTLLSSDQSTLYSPATASESTIYVQNLYSLTAGVTYVFDIQGVVSSGTIFLDGTTAPFHMYADGIALTTPQPTGSYAQAYFNLNSGWSNTNTVSYGDFTFTGSDDTLTVRQSSGISLTAAASNLPGITFTPPISSAVYMITATAVVFHGSSGGAISLQLTDGITPIQNSNQFQQQSGTATVLSTITLSGIYVPNTTSPVTVKLQGMVSAGTGFISGGENLGANTLEFTILRIA